MRSPLDRFHRAQEDPHAGFAAAMAELRAGRKQGHWIWYVFPQLSGLGSSAQSRTYGIDGLEEALAYLDDDLLRARLAEAISVVAEEIRKGVALETLMASSIDVRKLVSSLTLFEAAAIALYERDGLDECGRLATLSDEV